MLPINPKTLNNTRFALIHRTHLRSQIIYTIIVFAIVIALTTLPFLSTTITIKGIGMIKSEYEKVEIFVPINGRLLHLNLMDNQKVSKGTTLMIIDSTQPKKLKNAIRLRKSNLIGYLKDIEELIQLSQAHKNEPFKPRTALYFASWQLYLEQFRNATNAYQQAARTYKRYDVLYYKKAITKAELEQYKFNYDQALSEQQIIAKKYNNQWQNEANQYRKELQDLNHEETKLNDQEKQYTLRSPISGSIQNLTGIKEGSYIYANQKIGEISPNGTLFAYCYVKPSDIGLIKIGQPVSIHVNAFNYNQWGVISANVIDISDDVIIEHQLPYFKIKCRLDNNYLQLKNGYKGYLKKGMNLNASFIVAKRTLYQLLYDNVDDWLNPIVTRNQ